MLTSFRQNVELFWASTLAFFPVVKVEELAGDDGDADGLLLVQTQNESDLLSFVVVWHAVLAAQARLAKRALFRLVVEKVFPLLDHWGLFVNNFWREAVQIALLFFVPWCAHELQLTRDLEILL